MALIPGTRLGPYEVLAPLGAGGMGEVYRARDSKLGRDVALKVLPEAFARDAERRARFQREAKVLASLSHPNIAPIYGLEDSGSTSALVMELIEGPTLADRVKSGAIPIDEALPIAKQICEALEYAHERGIVHRDLKPANIKVTRDDAVKILDFGLAKAIEGDPASIDISNSPTITRMATQAGVLLGTAAYMSPEQARGRVVDRRADIWAFGCVLYEMLTGEMAFQGESVTDTLAAVIKEEPKWSQLPSETPGPVRALLQRCLQKDPKQRLRDIGDARISLNEVLAGVPEPSSVIRENRTASAEPMHRKDSVGDKVTRSTGGSRAAIWIAVGLLLLAGGGYWVHTASEHSKAEHAPAIAAVVPPEPAAPQAQKPSVEKPATDHPVQTTHPTQSVSGQGTGTDATLRPITPPAPAGPGPIAAEATIGTGNAQLQPYTAPDQSSSVGVPSEWKVTKAANGVIQMSGPQGEQISLGNNLFVSDGAFQAGQKPNGNISMSMPYQATLNQKYVMLWQQAAAASGDPMPQVSFFSATPIPLAKNIAECAVYLGTMTTVTKSTKFESRFCSLPLDSGGIFRLFWMHASIPAALAAQERPTAEAVLASYKLAPATLKLLFQPYTPSMPAAHVGVGSDPVTPRGERTADQAATCMDLGVIREEPEALLPSYCH